MLIYSTCNHSVNDKLPNNLNEAFFVNAVLKTATFLDRLDIHLCNTFLDIAPNFQFSVVTIGVSNIILWLKLLSTDDDNSYLIQHNFPKTWKVT